MNVYVKCSFCGWVYYAVTQAEAQKMVDNFNVYFDGLPKEEQFKFYGGKRSTIDPMTKCHCGKKRFKSIKVPPMGVTLNPMIWEKKKWW